jgi:hypothetical protein
MDPELFTRPQGSGLPRLSPENRSALVTCWSVCPVRRECLRDCQSGPDKPVSLIQGGWLWDAQGRGSSGLKHVLEEVAAPRRHYGDNGPPAIAAARAWLAGGVTMRAVATKFGVTSTYVQWAVALVRHDPELANAVAKGELSLSAARDQARRDRSAKVAAA